MSFKRFERAKTAKLWKIFDKYASVELDGEKYMTPDDFIRKYLKLLTTDNYHPGSLKLLGGIIDTSKDGLISFPEFQAFEGLLCIPDALYFTAFRLFDTSGNGFVSFDEFEEIISQTTLQQKIPFDLNGKFVRLYFGKKKDRVVSYGEFSQFLYDFNEEYAREAFRRFDKDSTGFVSVDDFEVIMTSARAHVLTKSVTANLKKVVKRVTGYDRVSFPFFTAINFLLSDMEQLKKIYLQAAGGSSTRPVSKDEFLSAANSVTRISPLEVEILYKLCELMHEQEEPCKIVMSDLQAISPEQYYKKVTQRVLDIKAVERPEDRNLFIEFLESVYRFTIGTIAGAIEAIGMYPMDIVKTRMQAQRCIAEKRLYRNNYDCFYKVWKYEGFPGMYRGLFAHILAVSLGKALKLTMNDWVRDRLINRKGKVSFLGGVFAGACAGASNVLVTNPLEMIKIRIQMAGEERRPQKIRAFKIVRSIGISGLYKGFTASLLRDVPFSAIFFPVYAHMKVRLQDANGYNSPMSVAIAGALATVPGAPVSMVFDVIKTRIQMLPKPGQVAYNGILETAKRIYQEEGPRAFWQGTRIVKPSQFGVTLLLYEVLQRIFYIDFAGTRPTGSEATVLITNTTQVKSINPEHIGGYALALPILSGIESKFGLVFPQFRDQVIERL